METKDSQCRGRTLAGTFPAQPIFTVKGNSLVLQAYRNNRFLMDTGATLFIMNENIRQKSFMKPSVMIPILETAIGDRISVHGVAQIQFILGCEVIQENVLLRTEN